MAPVLSSLALLAGLPLAAGFGAAAPDQPTLTGVKTSYIVEKTPEQFAVTLEQLQAGLALPGVVKWAQPAKVPWECVDGRSTSPVFGTPGGDAGEFLAAFSALYPLASPEVKAKPLGVLTKELFLSYLEEEITEERPFYMHTDMESTDKVKEQLKCADDACALFFPDPDDEEALLRMLGDEDATYVGCGHLKYMVQKPELYNTDPKMVIALIQAFYEYAWAQPDSSKLKLEVHSHGPGGHEHPHGGQVAEWSGKVLVVDLPGPHEEGAVLVVATENEDPDPECVAPMVTPSFTNEDGEYHQYFVDHSLSPAANALRKKNAAFFSKHLDLDSTDDNEGKIDDWNKQAHKIESQLKQFDAYDLDKSGGLSEAELAQADEDIQNSLKGVGSVSLDDFITATNAVAEEELLATVGILASTLPLVSTEFESEGGSNPRC